MSPYLHRDDTGLLQELAVKTNIPSYNNNTSWSSYENEIYIQRVPINIVHEEIVDFLKSWSD